MLNEIDRFVIKDSYEKLNNIWLVIILGFNHEGSALIYSIQ